MFMACLNMLNKDQSCLYTSPLGPRFSFSNDFADSQHPIKKHETSYREAPASSDFEFSVKNYSVTSASADEIFFKGLLIPAKPKTLRDELLVADDDDDDGFGDVLPRLQKSSGRWKHRFGLKRGDRGDGSLERVVEENPQSQVEQGARLQHYDQGNGTCN